MKSKSEILNNLAQFTGTETYHRWSPIFPKAVATDGVIYLAEQCHSFWLLDVIGSVLPLPKVKSEAFLTAIFSKEQGKVVIDDGDGNVLYVQEIASPTFPLDEIRLFVTDGEEGMRVIMLPSEY